MLKSWGIWCSKKMDHQPSYGPPTLLSSAYWGGQWWQSYTCFQQKNTNPMTGPQRKWSKWGTLCEHQNHQEGFLPKYLTWCALSMAVEKSMGMSEMNFTEKASVVLGSTYSLATCNESFERQDSLSLRPHQFWGLSWKTNHPSLQHTFFDMAKTYPSISVTFFPVDLGESWLKNFGWSISEAKSWGGGDSDIDSLYLGLGGFLPTRPGFFDGKNTCTSFFY